MPTFFTVSFLGGGFPYSNRQKKVGTLIVLLSTGGPSCGWWRSHCAPRNETMVDFITCVGIYRGINSFLWVS